MRRASTQPLDAPEALPASQDAHHVISIHLLVLQDGDLAVEDEIHRVVDGASELHVRILCVHVVPHRPDDLAQTVLVAVREHRMVDDQVREGVVQDGVQDVPGTPAQQLREHHAPARLPHMSDVLQRVVDQRHRHVFPVHEQLDAVDEVPEPEERVVELVQDGEDLPGAHAERHAEHKDDGDVGDDQFGVVRVPRGDRGEREAVHRQVQEVTVPLELVGRGHGMGVAVRAPHCPRGEDGDERRHAENEQRAPHQHVPEAYHEDVGVELAPGGLNVI